MKCYDISFLRTLKIQNDDFEAALTDFAAALSDSKPAIDTIDIPRGRYLISDPLANLVMFG